MEICLRRQSSGKCLFLKTAKSLSCQQLGLAVFDESITIIDAIGKLLAAKKTANLRSNYVDSLKFYNTKFAKGREQTPLNQFTFKDVEAWLAQFENANARQTWLNRISTLFSFAVRRGWIAANPCDRIDRVRVDHNPPAILTPKQAGALLALVPTLSRPYLILTLFAGIRPEEVMRLDWSAINLETKTVRVEGKTRQRRIVPLEPNAAALLAGCPLRRGSVTPSLATLRRFKRRARAALGLAKFPQDLFRHTAASYLLALHGDAGKVATMLGNSSSVLLRHYHEPVSQADCALFWALGMTKNDQGGLVAKGGGATMEANGKADGQNLAENHAEIKAVNGGASPQGTAQFEFFSGEGVSNAA